MHSIVRSPIRTSSFINKEIVEILRQPQLMAQIPEVNRDNFAKHLTITKLKIENAIAIIRAGVPQEEAR